MAVALGLLVASVPALADQTEVYIHDRGELLVGEPTGQADLRLDAEATPISGVGTYEDYGFTVENASNRLEIDLHYDAGPTGPAVPLGPCVKANDLDLYATGPDWGRSYPGCDDGHLTVLADDVPTGEYTVRIEATQGATACLPSEEGVSCSSPGIEYRIEIQVWQVR